MRETLYSGLYQPEGVLKLLRLLVKKHLPQERRLYTTQLVCWLMVGQFLLGIGSLKTAVLETFEAGSRELLGNCKRKRDGQWSKNTGGLSQARMRVPLEYFELLLSKFHEMLHGKELLWQGRRVYSIDGTSLQLEPTEKLQSRYKPGRNQRGESVFPVVCVTVAHDLLSGVAHRPQWAPMYGEERESEVSQTLKLLEELQPGSVVVSDSAHGIFFIAYKAAQCGLEVVYRLTESRARSMLNVKVLNEDRDEVFSWKPSPSERKKHPSLPPDALIQGRLIVRTILRDNKAIKLALFTTLTEPSAEDIVQLYGKRWIIEGDIRDLKKTLLLDELSAHTPEVIDRGILSAIIAYNLIRAVILDAAIEHGVEDPRRISFKNALIVIQHFTRDLMRIRSQSECQDIYKKMLEWVVSSINKKRVRPS
jgi:hypothetical protein